MLRSSALPMTRLPLLLAAALSSWIALMTSSCAPPASSAAPCNDDSDCSAEEHCQQGRCLAGAPLVEPLADGGRLSDASAAPGDAGPDVPPAADAGSDGGAPVPVDGGAGDASSLPDAAAVEEDAGNDEGGTIDDAGADAGVVCAGNDEDEDGIPDSCDNCPSIPNPGQANDGELQSGAAADSVGDACDPRPRAPGDFIALFESFSDAASTSWQSGSCTWTVAGGVITQSEGNGAKNCRLNFPSISSRRVVVETRMRLLTLDNATSSNAGVMVSTVGNSGWLCSAHTGDMLNIYRVTDGAAAAKSRFPAPFDADDDVTLRAGGGGSQMLCTSNPGGGVYHHVIDRRDIGAVALRTNDATAAFAYVVVYRVEGDILAALPEPPVHRYSFEGAAADSDIALDSVGEAHGWHKGSASQSGGSVLIDGNSNGYVDLPNGLLSSLSAVTLETWVTWNGNAAGDWQHLLDFGTSSVGELTGVEDPDAGLVYNGVGVSTLILVPQTNAAQSLVRLRDKVGGEVFQLEAEPFPSGRPVHVAISYDPNAGVAVFYLDGGERQRQSGSMPLSDLDDVNNWIGRSGWSNDSRFDGAVDEVRIYDRALSPDEVLGSFQGGASASF